MSEENKDDNAEVNNQEDQDKLAYENISALLKKGNGEDKRKEIKET